MIDMSDLKKAFMKMDRDFVCEAFACVVMQLYEHGVKFLEGPQGSELAEYFDSDGTRRVATGLLPDVPAEERVQLDFSGFHLPMNQRMKR